MSYTVEDVDRAVEGGFAYHYTLRSGEVRASTSGGWEELEAALDWDGGRADLGVGTATLVGRHGGTDQGSEYWFVFKVTDAEGGERLFRRNGYYQSFEGADLDGPTEEVAAVKKTVTVFEAV